MGRHRMFDDLRGFIDVVEQIGECRVVENADWDVEIGSITEVVLDRKNPPMLLFNSIKGYPPGYRIVTGAFATPKRILLALGSKDYEQELVDYFRNRMKGGIKPIPPVEIKS